MNNSHKVFHLRLRVKYGPEVAFIVEKFNDQSGNWQCLPINEKTPGLLVFLYSILTCQHLFLHNPAKEAGLNPVRTEAALIARFDKSRFRFESIYSHFLAYTTTEPSCQQAQFITDKMENCPVSSNLHPAIEQKLALRFVLAKKQRRPVCHQSED